MVVERKIIDMNSNWFKVALKATNVKYGKNLLLKGIPIIFNKSGANLEIGENCTIKKDGAVFCWCAGHGTNLAGESPVAGICRQA